MDKKTFLDFCRKEFLCRGFRKIKNMYYYEGKSGVLCGIDLQKSSFGSLYYINVNYFLIDFEASCASFPYPMYYESDIYGRIAVMSKNQKDQNGNTYMTSQICYEEYSQEELKMMFEVAFIEWIMPCIQQGTSFIRKMVEIEFLEVHPEREIQVKKFLNVL